MNVESTKLSLIQSIASTANSDFLRDLLELTKSKYKSELQPKSYIQKEVKLADWMVQEIEAAEEDIREGRVYSNEDHKKKTQQWLDEN